MLSRSRFGLRNWTLLMILTSVSVQLAGCALSGSESNEGPVWLGELVVTTEMDEKGEPTDAVTELSYGIERVYCFLRIRGPENVVLGMRVFYEDQLAGEAALAFGAERKAARDIVNKKTSGPLPRGRYRCEVFAVKDALRTAEFTIK